VKYLGDASLVTWMITWLARLVGADLEVLSYAQILRIRRVGGYTDPKAYI
jgi:hypothetical protein